MFLPVLVAITLLMIAFLHTPMSIGAKSTRSSTNNQIVSKLSGKFNKMSAASTSTNIEAHTRSTYTPPTLGLGLSVKNSDNSVTYSPLLHSVNLIVFCIYSNSILLFFFLLKCVVYSTQSESDCDRQCYSTYIDDIDIKIYSYYITLFKRLIYS